MILLCSSTSFRTHYLSDRGGAVEINECHLSVRHVVDIAGLHDELQ